MPSLVPIVIANDNFGVWINLTNNLVSWANIGVYTNGTPTAASANVIIVGETTSTVYHLRDTSPTINFKNLANATLGYIKYDTSGNNFSLFSSSANASLSYNANGTLSVNSVIVVTRSATETLTNKTLTSPTISGGTITGITDLTVADGGTGASDAATARTNLGLIIGTNVQAYDAELAAIAGLVSATNTLPYFTGSGTASLTPLTGFARTVLDDPDAVTLRGTIGVGTISTQNSNNVIITGGSVTGITDITIADGGTGASDAPTARSNLGLVIGTDVQAYDAGLLSIAGLTTSANLMIYTTGSDTYATTALTGSARTFLAAVDAAAQRTAMGLGTMAVEAVVNYANLASAQIFTGLKTVSVGTSVTALDYMALKPNDYAVNKPGVFFTKTTTANVWTLQLFDGTNNNGTINVVSSSFMYNGANVVTDTNTLTLTNKTLTSPTINGATMTGLVTAPSQANGTANTTVATTQFVSWAVATGGGGYQPLDAELTAISGITAAADKMIYFSNSSFATTTTITTFGRSLVDDADATTARTTLGLGTIAVNATSDFVSVGNTQTITSLKTFQPNANGTTARDYIAFKSNNYGTGIPGLFIGKNQSSANSWSITVYDGTDNNGLLNIISSNVAWNGDQIVSQNSTVNMSNKTLSSPRMLGTTYASGWVLVGNTSPITITALTNGNSSPSSQRDYFHIEPQDYNTANAITTQLVVAKSVSTADAIFSYDKWLLTINKADTRGVPGPGTLALSSVLQIDVDNIDFMNAALTANTATIKSISSNAITSNTLSLSTALPITSGGTGGSTITAARNNFSIGTGDNVAFSRVHSGSNTTTFSPDTATEPCSYLSGAGISRMSGSSSQALSMQRTGSNGVVIAFWKGTTSVGDISVTASNTVFNTSSDYRLKYDVSSLVNYTIDKKEIEIFSPNLTKIMALRPVSYKWYSDDEDQELSYGLIAHEAQEVIPGIVSGVKDGEESIFNLYKNTELIAENIIESHLIDYEFTEKVSVGTRPVYQKVDYSKLTPYLTAGMQEQTILIIEQQKRLDAQDAIIETLMARLDALEKK